MGKSKYSCETAAETLEWINDIVRFIKPYDFLINAHVVNFFTDKLWESLDPDWLRSLRREPLQNLLLIPSGVVQEHWPVTLKELVLTLSSLSLPRCQVPLDKVFPGLKLTSLNCVLAQGMNAKKKHEVEVLSAVVSSIVNHVGAQAVVDVGAGQGYLAQVLSFQYQHPVVAIDASSHHGRVTESRAERIKKHYAAQIRKNGSEIKIPPVPKTIACRVMSVEALKSLTNMSLHANYPDNPGLNGQVTGSRTSLVLAGLHACGDLSVVMLKTFLDWKEVKAVVSVGCCYNLLSEESFDVSSSQLGFPVSSGFKSVALSLGKSSRDLACQSAERWSTLERDAGIQNFELHAFRAAFQMALCRYFPDMTSANASIGRQGKALRRKQQKRIMQCSPEHKDSEVTLIGQRTSVVNDAGLALVHEDSKTDGADGVSRLWHSMFIAFDENCVTCPVDDSEGSLVDSEALTHASSCNGSRRHEESSSYSFELFEKFSLAGLSRLGLEPSQKINFHEIWSEAKPFADLIGPFWSLRAAFGPVLETLILLDRLLLLQEQGGSVEAAMLPIFDAALSPRNVAILATRT